MPLVTLYTKPDCPLCDTAAEALDRVRARHPFDLQAVDVSSDPELQARHGERLPVVLLDGEPLFEYFVDEQALELKLAATGAAR